MRITASKVVSVIVVAIADATTVSRRSCRAAGLAATHNALWDEAREPYVIATAADARSERTLELFHRQLGRALAQVINIIDPDVIVLGGGLSLIESIYRRVPELWCDYVFSDKVATALRPALHGAAGGVRGAAWLWPAVDTINLT